MAPSSLQSEEKGMSLLVEIEGDPLNMQHAQQEEEGLSLFVIVTDDDDEEVIWWFYW